MLMLYESIRIFKIEEIFYLISDVQMNNFLTLENFKGVNMID